MQPQPKKRKIRKRKNNADDVTNSQGWNGILKNISGENVSDVEQKFCPVEMDPPIIRMQEELNRFYRILRIKWFFRGKSDERSELEKKCYPKSDWEPPKACVEVEKSSNTFKTSLTPGDPPDGSMTICLLKKGNF